MGTASWFDTHEVTNQPPPLLGHDAFGSNRPLAESVARIAGPEVLPGLRDIGLLTGSAEVLEWAVAANQHPPVLRTHDRYGNRVDVVDYHPAYHQLMSAAIEHRLHAAAWVDPSPHRHLRRAAGFMTWYQGDAGHTCPISMTYSSLPALRHQPDLAALLEPGLTSTTYDPSNQVGSAKAGLTVGMAMTEKQGGSDVRANQTTARPVAAGGTGHEYLLTGHKWFCSAPMSDGFLVLAQAPDGLSCFWMPRWRPDGTKNPIRIQRLKDKLGDRSNASSEIEMLDTWAVLIGDEGAGVRTIIEMVNHTRLDCALGSAAVMRSGVAQATWHTHHRSAFGRVLDGQPLMAAVLADLALESEAATLAAVRLASSFDAPADDQPAALFRRLAGPVIKYWTCKRAVSHAAEALECFGGVGYVEESHMPRLLRQSPVNGIWEGSGNVICLDVLRAMAKAPDAVTVLLDELAAVRGVDRRYDAALDSLGTQLLDTTDVEVRARSLVEALAVQLQASLVLQHSPAAVADAFCAARLGARHGGLAYGTLPIGVDLGAIVERHRPTPLDQT